MGAQKNKKGKSSCEEDCCDEEVFKSVEESQVEAGGDEDEFLNKMDGDKTNEDHTKDDNSKPTNEGKSIKRSSSAAGDRRPGSSQGGRRSSSSSSQNRKNRPGSAASDTNDDKKSIWGYIASPFKSLSNWYDSYEEAPKNAGSSKQKRCASTPPDVRYDTRGTDHRGRPKSITRSYDERDVSADDESCFKRGRSCCIKEGANSAEATPRERQLPKRLLKPQ